MEEAIEECRRRSGSWQERTPVLEWPMACQLEASRLVCGGDQAEQQLRTGLIERRQPHFIDEHHVIPRQAVDNTADGVIGETAIELLDQVGRPP